MFLAAELNPFYFKVWMLFRPLVSLCISSVWAEPIVDGTWSSHHYHAPCGGFSVCLACRPRAFSVHQWPEVTPVPFTIALYLNSLIFPILKARRENGPACLAPPRDSHNWTPRYYEMEPRPIHWTFPDQSKMGLGHRCDSLGPLSHCPGELWWCSLRPKMF